MIYICDFFYFLNWLILSIPENGPQYAASGRISEDELLSYDPCARIVREKNESNSSESSLLSAQLIHDLEETCGLDDRSVIGYKVG